MRPLEDLLTEEGLDHVATNESSFDYGEAAHYCVATVFLCIGSRDADGLRQHAGGLVALDIDIEHLKLTPEELNWTLGVLTNLA